MNGAKISVIIPIYNHADYIIECLSSVVNQQDENFEIVAIDDGSVDKSYELAREYLRENLDVTCWTISTRENRGINRTLNEAICKSTGEIIYLLASDDRMPADSLGAIREVYFREQDKCKLFFYDVNLIDCEGNQVCKGAAGDRKGGASLLEYSKRHLATQIILRWGNPFQHQFYSRRFFDKFGLYPETMKYEDLGMALYAISIDSFTFIPLILKEYRLRKSQIHTPGLTLDDLNQTAIRNVYRKSVRLDYSLILLLGRLDFSAHTRIGRYIFGKFSALLQRLIYLWSMFFFNRQAKNYH